MVKGLRQMNNFLRNRLFIKPRIELDPLFRIIIIFYNGRTIVHEHMTEVIENGLSFVVCNSYEHYIYKREDVAAVKMEEEYRIN